jgi:hypothetical protein
VGVAIEASTTDFKGLGSCHPRVIENMVGDVKGSTGDAAKETHIPNVSSLKMFRERKRDSRWSSSCCFCPKKVFRMA